MPGQLQLARAIPSRPGSPVGPEQYASELTWNGGKSVEGEYQAAINRVGRATLGAYRSTPLGMVFVISYLLSRYVRPVRAMAAACRCPRGQQPIFPAFKKQILSPTG